MEGCSGRLDEQDIGRERHFVLAKSTDSLIVQDRQLLEGLVNIGSLQVVDSQSFTRKDQMKRHYLA
jgi:hypothetical protein